MKSRLRQLGVLLLLLGMGAIVNIAVAWGLAFRMAEPAWSTKRSVTIVANNVPWELLDRSVRGQRELYWSQLNPEERTPRIEAEMQNNPRRDRMGYASQADEMPGWGGLARGEVPIGIVTERDRAFGWPFVAFWYGVVDLKDSAGVHERRLLGGWLQRGSLDLTTYDFVAVPYSVVWPGFAINTIVFAALLWFGMSFHDERGDRNNAGTH